MKAFFACIKRECMESVRNGRALIPAILFLGLGIFNPAMAKLTPWLMSVLSDSLADAGMIVTDVSVDALTSWGQFFKNIPMALIVFLLLFGQTLTREYAAGTLIIPLTKGLSRTALLLAKTVWMLLLWTAGYALSFGTTYLYNDFFWDNTIAVHLWSTALAWYLFGVWVIGLCILFSAIFCGNAAVLMGIGGAVLLSYLLGLLPRVGRYVPTVLMNTASIAPDPPAPAAGSAAFLITLALGAASVAISVPLFRKKAL